MRNHIRILCVLAVPVIAAGCDESLSSLAGPTPNLEPTFSAIQRDIFESTDAAGRTACVNCHNAIGVQFNRLNLERAVSYDQLVNVPSAQRPGVPRVDPGNPDGSYLIQKLEGAPGIVGMRMPLNGPPYLTDGQIEIIRRWIASGAARD
jgi:hypothetical protein